MQITHNAPSLIEKQNTWKKNEGGNVCVCVCVLTFDILHWCEALNKILQELQILQLPGGF